MLWVHVTSHMMSRCWIFSSLYIMLVYLLCKIIKPPVVAWKLPFSKPSESVKQLYNHLSSLISTQRSANPLRAIGTSPFLSFWGWGCHSQELPPLDRALVLMLLLIIYIHFSWWNKWSFCLYHTGIYPVQFPFSHLTYLTLPLSQKRWLLFSLCLGPLSVSHDYGAAVVSLEFHMIREQ